MVVNVDAHHGRVHHNAAQLAAEEGLIVLAGCVMDAGLQVGKDLKHAQGVSQCATEVLGRRYKQHAEASALATYLISGQDGRRQSPPHVAVRVSVQVLSIIYVSYRSC